MGGRSWRAGIVQRVAPLPMTPMIDIVFLLLVFFIMTFRIVAREGDLSIGAPPSSGSHLPSQLPLQLPLHVGLTANPGGRLEAVYLDGRLLAGLDELRRHIRSRVDSSGSPMADQDRPVVVLHCDYGLDYRATIGAITAVRGYISTNGDHVELVKSVRFAPPSQSTECTKTRRQPRG